MILTEAMAAGAAVVASDLDAFRRVLDGGRAGAAVPHRRRGGAAAGCSASCWTTRHAARSCAACADQVVAAFDWPVVARRVLEVYAAAIEATDGRVIDQEWAGLG